MPTRTVCKCSQCCELPFVSVNASLLPFDYEITKIMYQGYATFYVRFVTDPITRVTATRTDASTVTADFNNAASAWGERGPNRKLISEMDASDSMTLINYLYIYIPHSSLYVNGGLYGYGYPIGHADAIFPQALRASLDYPSGGIAGTPYVVSYQPASDPIIYGSSQTVTAANNGVRNYVR